MSRASVLVRVAGRQPRPRTGLTRDIKGLLLPAYSYKVNLTLRIGGFFLIHLMYTRDDSLFLPKTLDRVNKSTTTDYL